MAMQTAEPESTREGIEIMVNSIYSTYAKEELGNISANVVHTNADDRTKLINILKESEEFFDGTIREWDTETTDLAKNPNYKPVNSKYYPIPKINN